MGDAGEGLIDADSRIQERLEELERERSAKQAPVVRNPELVRALESLRLARTELERQLCEFILRGIGLGGAAIASHLDRATPLDPGQSVAAEGA